MTTRRLSILGVGLLGGSIGLRLKESTNHYEIIGYGHRAETLAAARQLGAIDRVATSLGDAVTGADLVVLCTPVGTFEPILREIAGHLEPGAIVTDVGSAKRSVCRYAEQLLPAGVHFVGSHPMAGSEKRGVEAARADLYNSALCITTPTPKTDPAALRTVESFWQSIGMRVTRLSPDDHDRLLADVSHLPHAVAACLVMLQSDESLPLAGKGFLDTTRIAAGDASLWRDIFIDNADNVRHSIRSLRQNLDRLETLLDPAKANELRDWLDHAAAKRRGKMG